MLQLYLAPITLGISLITIINVRWGSVVHISSKQNMNTVEEDLETLPAIILTGSKTILADPTLLEMVP